jgi:hypothetical protein
MADNVGYTPGTGAIVAADEIGGVLHQRIKIGIGADGSATDVSEANPMPSVVQRTDDLLVMLQRLVKVCETLQIVDSAQRQRVTIDAITGNLTLAGVSTVSTVSTVNVVNTVSAQTAMAGMDREMYINIAKQTYALAIRSNLTFQ